MVHTSVSSLDCFSTCDLRTSQSRNSHVSNGNITHVMIGTAMGMTGMTAIEFGRPLVTGRSNGISTTRTGSIAMLVSLEPVKSGLKKESEPKMITDWRRSPDAIAERAGWSEGEIRTKAFRHTYRAARLQTLDSGAPISVCMVAKERTAATRWFAGRTATWE
jgi:hypothetical protein